MNVLVTIKETANINDVSAELVQKGFVVMTTLSEIGVITGDCPADRRAEIEQIDGISSVEDETEMTASGKMTEHGLSHGDFMGMSLPSVG